jgi:hypothetical protein
LCSPLTGIENTAEGRRRGSPLSFDAGSQL